MQCSGRESQRYLRFRGNFLIDLKKSTQFLQELPNTKYLRKSNFQSLGKNIIHKRSHSMIVAVIYIAPNPGFNLNKLTWNMHEVNFTDYDDTISLSITIRRSDRNRHHREFWILNTEPAEPIVCRFGVDAKFCENKALASEGPIPTSRITIIVGFASLPWTRHFVFTFRFVKPAASPSNCKFQTIGSLAYRRWRCRLKCSHIWQMAHGETPSHCEAAQENWVSICTTRFSFIENQNCF